MVPCSLDRAARAGRALHSHSLIAVGLQRCNVRRELLDLAIQASHLSAEFVHVNPEHFLAARAFQKHAHRVAGQVRDAARACY